MEKQRKIKATISYDGSRFNGFQIQNSGVTTVVNKLQTVLKSIGITTKIKASGRTDAGVHATGQVIDFEIPHYWSDTKRLRALINQKSDGDIWVKDIKFAEDDFHARFSAKKRVYRYIVSTKEPSVFMNPYLLFVPFVDEMHMKEVIKQLEGTHDFNYFMKSGSSAKNTMRIMYRCRCYRYKDFYVFVFEANGFLRSQIRMMMHFLLEINAGRRTVEELSLQLSCQKRFTTHLVPPNGLYLSRIKY